LTRARDRVCVDLFSGLGGFSQAFLDKGWTVYRYDNDEQFKKVPCTHIVDVLELTPEMIKGEHEEVDILLMSPPCNCFSTMTIRYYWKNGVPDERARAAIQLVKHALWLKDQIPPTFWVLENPIGMLVRVLGQPMMRTWWAAWGSNCLKPTNLWGILPAINWPKRPTSGYEKIPRDAKDRQRGVQGIKDGALSAMVPYEFSKALCMAIENDSGGQTPLAAFYDHQSPGRNK